MQLKNTMKEKTNKPENTQTNDPTVLPKNPKQVWQEDHGYSLQ